MPDSAASREAAVEDGVAGAGEGGAQVRFRRPRHRAAQHVGGDRRGALAGVVAADAVDHAVDALRLVEEEAVFVLLPLQAGMGVAGGAAARGAHAQAAPTRLKCSTITPASPNWARAPTGTHCSRSRAGAVEAGRDADVVHRRAEAADVLDRDAAARLAAQVQVGARDVVGPLHGHVDLGAASAAPDADQIADERRVVLLAGAVAIGQLAPRRGGRDARRRRAGVDRRGRPPRRVRRRRQNLRRSQGLARSWTRNRTRSWTRSGARRPGSGPGSEPGSERGSEPGSELSSEPGSESTAEPELPSGWTRCVGSPARIACAGGWPSSDVMRMWPGSSSSSSSG